MRVSRMLIGAMLTVALVSGNAMAQKKPAPKPQPPKPKTGVLGTTQLAGDNGQVGVTYTIGPKDQQLNLTLESAQYALRYPTIVPGVDAIVAQAGKRVLVLTFTAQNPRPVEEQLSYDSFRFTVVSPDDQNFDYNGTPVHPERKNIGDTTLKPGQKVRFIIPIVIHPKGPVNKLMVQRHDSTPILRYDLRGKVKPLAGVFAGDSGETALDEGVAKFGEAFEYGPFDLTVEPPKALEVKEMEAQSAGEDSTLYALNMTIKNPTLTKQHIETGTFMVSLKNADGEKVEVNAGLFPASAARYIAVDMDAGQTMRVRLVGPVANDFKPTEVVLQMAEGRTVVLKLP